MMRRTFLRCLVPGFVIWITAGCYAVTSRAPLYDVTAERRVDPDLLGAWRNEHMEWRAAPTPLGSYEVTWTVFKPFEGDGCCRIEIECEPEEEWPWVEEFTVDLIPIGSRHFVFGVDSNTGMSNPHALPWFSLERRGDQMRIALLNTWHLHNLLHTQPGAPEYVVSKPIPMTFRHGAEPNSFHVDICGPGELELLDNPVKIRQFLQAHQDDDALHLASEAGWMKRQAPR